METEWTVAWNSRKEVLVYLVAYVYVAFGGSFGRDHEVFLVDLFGLLKYR